MAMDLTPRSLASVGLPRGRIELVEWHWPEIIAFTRVEEDLMLEMSLAPHATDASAEFPRIAKGEHCFVGTLFVRYPGVVIHGRGRGGRIRVLRFVFDDAAKRAIVGDAGPPPLRALQRLLDIRSDSLRTLMHLASREMMMAEDCSAAVLAAFQDIVGVELRRLLARQLGAARGGRLADWQYQRIRARLAEPGPVPTAPELAALCGISTRHLNRQFLALTGSTVAHYVRNFWIERAKALLDGGEPSIKVIAFETGFSHANSFSRAFRQATGSTPGEYRQRAAPIAPRPAGAARASAPGGIPQGRKQSGPD